MSDMYVVAGTYDQYQSYARSKAGDNKFYIYVNSPDTLRGLRDPHGVFIGTWITRPDIGGIIDALLVATSSQTTFNTGVKKAYDLLSSKESV